MTGLRFTGHAWDTDTGRCAQCGTPRTNTHDTSDCPAIGEG